MDDHHQEVIAYCRENGFHGLMADDGEYAIFDPPRYFSSEHLKLTYKVSIIITFYFLLGTSSNANADCRILCRIINTNLHHIIGWGLTVEIYNVIFS